MTGGGSHGAGSKRPARTDASALFKRGGPKAMRPAHRPGDAAGRAGWGGPDEEGDDRRDDEWGCATTTTATGGGGEVEPSRDGSLASHPRLAAKLRALCSALERPAGAHPNNLSVARWTATGDAALPFVAELLRTRGKHFTKFGHVCGARTYLLPEEVLFLVETERLAVVPPGRSRKTNDDEKKNDGETNDGDDPAVSGAAMSLRAVRDAVTRRCGVREAWYQVFAKLAREGYTVRRFDSPWCQPPRGFSSGGGGGDHAAFAGSGPLAGDFTTNVLSRDETVPPPREEEESTRPVPAADGWWVDASTWTGAPMEPIVPEPPESEHAPDTSAPFPLPVFQVYAPNRHFSKRDPDDVAFFVFHGDRPPNSDEVRTAANATANGFREGRERRAKNAHREDSSRGAPYAIPGEKMVYAHVSDSTVMMYRMTPSRAPESDEVPQSL